MKIFSTDVLKNTSGWALLSIKSLTIYDKLKIFRSSILPLLIFQSNIRSIIDFCALSKNDGVWLCMCQKKLLLRSICGLATIWLEMTSKLLAHITTLINMAEKKLAEKNFKHLLKMCQGRNVIRNNKKVIYYGNMMEWK